ncbi:MAG TPA: hypothetical protein VML55_21380, partial [Planctomycetaceae bacterium]|nr:hypothetical protein [Planctomycetaceae bacterium]
MPAAGRTTQPLCLVLVGGIVVAIVAAAIVAPALPVFGQAATGLGQPAGTDPRSLDGGATLSDPPLAGPGEPMPGTGDRIAIRADYSQEWIDGETAVAVLRGRCEMTQGSARVTASQMVIRREHRNGRDRLKVYLEDAVRLERPGQSRTEPSLVLTLTAHDGLDWNVRRRVENQPADADPLYVRAVERLNGSRRLHVTPTQLVVPDVPAEGPELRGVEIEPPAGNLRRIRISPRSAVPFDVQIARSDATTPPEQVSILTGGITVVVDGVDEFGTVDLSADRAVIWTRAYGIAEFQTERIQTRDEPLTIYLEGNIVIRQDNHVLRAAQAVYDVREERALLLDAELRSFVPELQGDIRVRAAELRQLSHDSFYARNAWTTASQFGVPGYRLQASDVFIENRVVQPFFGLGELERDPV